MRFGDLEWINYKDRVIEYFRALLIQYVRHHEERLLRHIEARYRPNVSLEYFRTPEGQIDTPTLQEGNIWNYLDYMARRAMEEVRHNGGRLPARARPIDPGGMVLGGPSTPLTSAEDIQPERDNPHLAPDARVLRERDDNIVTPDQPVPGSTPENFSIGAPAAAGPSQHEYDVFSQEGSPGAITIWEPAAGEDPLPRILVPGRTNPDGSTTFQLLNILHTTLGQPLPATTRDQTCTFVEALDVQAIEGAPSRDPTPPRREPTPELTPQDDEDIMDGYRILFGNTVGEGE